MSERIMFFHADANSDIIVEYGENTDSVVLRAFACDRVIVHVLRFKDFLKLASYVFEAKYVEVCRRFTKTKMKIEDLEKKLEKADERTDTDYLEKTIERLKKRKEELKKMMEHLTGIHNMLADVYKLAAGEVD